MVSKTKGLIGLILDRFRICGGIVAEQIKNTEDFSEERKQLYLKSIALNFLYIVKTIGNKSAWNYISIGSDFDGMINSFEFYDTTEKMPELAKDLEYFFNHLPDDIFGYFSKKEMEELMYGYSAKEIIEKIFSKNAIQFYLNHFPENDLEH